MTRPMSDLDVPLPVLDRQIADLALQAAYQHQPEPMELAFADLAIHPTRHLATEADYPNWIPPHLEAAS